MYFRYVLQFPALLFNSTLSLEWHVHEIRIDGDSVPPLSWLAILGLTMGLWCVTGGHYYIGLCKCKSYVWHLYMNKCFFSDFWMWSLLPIMHGNSWDLKKWPMIIIYFIITIQLFFNYVSVNVYKWRSRRIAIIWNMFITVLGIFQLLFTKWWCCMTVKLWNMLLMGWGIFNSIYVNGLSEFID